MNILFFLIPKEDVSFIYEDNSVRQGIEKMRAHGYTAIPVLTRDGKYVGTISEGDFLWHLVDLNSTQLRIQESHYTRNQRHFHGRSFNACNGSKLCPGSG